MKARRHRLAFNLSRIRLVARTFGSQPNNTGPIPVCGNSKIFGENFDNLIFINSIHGIYAIDKIVNAIYNLMFYK